LPRFLVRDEQAVAALRLHAAPMAVADLEALAVLRVAHVARERDRPRIVRNDGIEIAIDHALETLPIARGLLRAGGRAGQKSCRGDERGGGWKSSHGSPKSFCPRRRRAPDRRMVNEPRRRARAAPLSRGR